MEEGSDADGQRMRKAGRMDGQTKKQKKRGETNKRKSGEPIADLDIGENSEQGGAVGICLTSLGDDDRLATIQCI